MEGAWLCYEEDCDGPVALRELMDKKLYQAPVNSISALVNMKRSSTAAYRPIIPNTGRRGNRT